MQRPVPAVARTAVSLSLFLFLHLQRPTAAVDTSARHCSLGARFAFNFADCSSYYQCVHGLPVLQRCPGDLVFSLRLERCLYRTDFVAGCSTSRPPAGLDEADSPSTTTEPPVGALVPELIQRCKSSAEGKLAHADLCHLYYDCRSINNANDTYTQPILSSCPFVMLFDDVTKTCAQPADVNCGNRLQPNRPWTRSELCSSDSQTLPHDEDCHRYYDCQGYVHPATRQGTGGSAPSDDILVRTCDYPLLYSPVARRCMAHDRVECGARREPVTPCAYRSDQRACEDPQYASCQGFSDGPHVYRTREGTPHYVQCRDQRTVEKHICPVDDRGLYQQFSPAYNKCMSIMTSQA